MAIKNHKLIFQPLKSVIQSPLFCFVGITAVQKGNIFFGEEKVRKRLEDR